MKRTVGSKTTAASQSVSSSSSLRRKQDSELMIDGKPVAVSRLEKVLYPRTGFTKGQVIDFYIQISPVLLPHLRGRPLTLKRYPNGVEQEFFYEKRCPPYRPEWIETAAMWSERTQSEIRFCVAGDLASLVWAANLADLELHTYLWRASDQKTPMMIVFDLDPGPPAGMLECGQVAIYLKRALDQIDLESYPKTSGSKGLQLCVPLNGRATFAESKSVAHVLAERLSREYPDLIVAKMEKNLRKGKVLIDWSQNDPHKTTVSVYSLRAKAEPTVSTPVTWDEIQRALKRSRPESLRFLASDVLRRVEKVGDLYAPVLKQKQKIPKEVQSL